MKIALVQVASPDDETRDERIRRVEALLRAASPVDLLVLPELWTVGYFNFDKYAESAETLDGPTVSMVARVARDLGSYIHAGSVVERMPDGTFRNTSLLLDPRGQIVHQYSKIHVFGYQSLEAELLTPGDRLEVTSSPFGAVTSTTCYDLRFPGLWLQLSDRGAEVAIVPAAWPAARLAHWQLLTSVRAVEHQLLVIACNATGIQRGVQLGGHSRIVDPTGRVLLELGDEEAIGVVEFDVSAIAEARREFPVIADRLDDYAGFRG